MRLLVVAVLVVWLGGAATAHADDLATPVREGSKKDAYWAAKQGAHEPLRKMDRKKLVGKKPGTVISLWNSWTHEWIAVDQKAKSVPDPVIDRFLRCHFTNEPTEMDSRLSGVLLEAARHFGATRINIVSGFRAPKYNLMLRKKGHEVARDSQHTKGDAVDFWMPKVNVKDLYDWAMAHQLGGVGYYESSGFIHVDVGKKRTWNGD